MATLGIHGFTICKPENVVRSGMRNLGLVAQSQASLAVKARNLPVKAQSENRSILAEIWPPAHLENFRQDPVELLDYSINWADELAAGESLSSVTVSAGAGLTVGSSWIDGERSFVWLSGGVLGGEYTVTISVGTSLPETLVRQFKISVDYR